MPRTVKDGSTGADAVLAQQCLKRAGYYKHTVDGWFGPESVKSLKRFQSANGHTPDGVCGPKTWTTLLKYAPLNPKPTPTPPQPITGWNTPTMEYDHQDTGYTCGASTLKMILSSYGIITDESELARRAGTRPIVGTDPYQIDRVLKEYIPSVTVQHLNYSSIGWEGLINKIKEGYRVIILYKTLGLPGWLNDYGHYSPVQGIKTGSILIYCPTKGAVWYQRDKFVTAMTKHPGKSAILIK